MLHGAQTSFLPSFGILSVSFPVCLPSFVCIHLSACLSVSVCQVGSVLPRLSVFRLSLSLTVVFAEAVTPAVGLSYLRHEKCLTPFFLSLGDQKCDT